MNRRRLMRPTAREQMGTEEETFLLISVALAASPGSPETSMRVWAC